MGGDELLQEQSAEQAREHAHGEEESGPAGHPTLAVGRDAAARHDHVHMRVMGQCRAPGVQHGGDADPGAQMLGVGGDRQHGLGRDLEQEIVDHGLVLVGDVGDRRRQREHHVIVRHRQQLGLARRRAIPSRRRPGTSGSAGCGRSCRQWSYRRSPRSARHGRRGLPCGSSRSPTSPSAGRG